jgi:hypothetical protein
MPAAPGLSYIVSRAVPSAEQETGLR